MRVARQLWDMSRRTEVETLSQRPGAKPRLDLEEMRVIAVVSHGHFIGRLLQEVLGPGFALPPSTRIATRTNTQTTPLQLCAGGVWDAIGQVPAPQHGHHVL